MPQVVGVLELALATKLPSTFLMAKSMRLLRAAVSFSAGAAAGALLSRPSPSKCDGMRSERLSHPKLVPRRDLLATQQGHKQLAVVPRSAAKFIAVLRILDDAGVAHEALVVLASGQGYSTVVALVDRRSPEARLNLMPSQRDFECLALAAAQVSAAFLRLGMFPQMELLGNNSHDID